MLKDFYPGSEDGLRHDSSYETSGANFLNFSEQDIESSDDNLDEVE